MPAGDSALRRSRELDAEADALFELSKRVKAEARDYVAASASERQLSGRLRALSRLGWTVLEDRRWPGSKRANVDFILVGPGGVVVLDAKYWAEMSVRDDALFRGQAREDEEVAKLVALLDRLTEGLAETGLTSSSVHAAMVFTGRRVDTHVGPIAVVGESDLPRWLSRLRHRLEPDQVEGVVAAVEACCPPMPTEPVRRKLLPSREPRPRPFEPPALIDVDELTQTLLETALAGPIEDWMTFLHPEQNRLVTAQWNGPARVRGPAGTGKTVVGLHRAVHLAQRHPDPVLFVSFVKTLPVVLQSLATRLAPTVVDRIEFTGVHGLAYRCLDLVGEPIRLDTRRSDRAFQQAWFGGSKNDVLTALDERPSYWKEEIDHVIKGRGLTALDDYLTLQRVGRRTPMRAEHRKAMWEVYLGYERRLAQAGIGDFNDLLIRATSAVDRYPSLFRYSAVLVDEVQDLNLVAVRFLSTLAGDQNPRLLFMGDGQQSVYPGGFTLGEAGISVAGRATVLNHNYRNTVEILDEARRLVSVDTFDNLEGIADLGAAEAHASRHGYPPLKVFARTQRDLDVALARQVQETRDHLGTPWGHMAVLAERTLTVDHIRRVLTTAGIPWVDLTTYDGTSTNRVKIGTIKRAKGLEFPYVLLPNLSQEPPDQMAGETPESYLERVERWRRELYVAMTRARDGLWLGYLGATPRRDGSPGSPS